MSHSERETEEPIRRWPVPVARLFNWLIRWTNDSCAAGCGYPISGRYRVEVEKYGETSIMWGVCSLRGACEQSVRDNPRDDTGRRYQDFRPEIIVALKAREEPTPFVVITY